MSPATKRRTGTEREPRPERLAVKKTYKLYIGGKFPRSESGRSHEVTDSKGRFLANAAWASRKDARDAVVAARKAFPGWSGATAYNRGQVLYRVAEVMEGRRAQFVDEVVAGEGIVLPPPARRVVPGDESGSSARMTSAVPAWSTVLP